MFENLTVLNYDSMNPVGGEGAVKAWLPPSKTINSLTACQRICFEAIGRRINTIHRHRCNCITFNLLQRTGLFMVFGKCFFLKNKENV